MTETQQKELEAYKEFFVAFKKRPANIKILDQFDYLKAKAFDVDEKVNELYKDSNIEQIYKDFYEQCSKVKMEGDLKINMSNFVYYLMEAKRKIDAINDKKNECEFTPKPIGEDWKRTLDNALVAITRSAAELKKWRQSKILHSHQLNRLAILYNVYKKSIVEFISLHDLEYLISNPDNGGYLNYLVSEGLLENGKFTQIKITHSGIKIIEWHIKNPNKRSEMFPELNKILL